MIELAEGIWVDPYAVALIKAIDDKSCSLWIRGQGALEGHVIPYAGVDVAEAINDALEDEDGGEEPEDDQD